MTCPANDFRALCGVGFLPHLQPSVAGSTPQQATCLAARNERSTMWIGKPCAATDRRYAKFVELEVEMEEGFTELEFED